MLLLAVFKSCFINHVHFLVVKNIKVSNDFRFNSLLIPCLEILQKKKNINIFPNNILLLKLIDILYFKKISPIFKIKINLYSCKARLGKLTQNEKR